MKNKHYKPSKKFKVKFRCDIDYDHKAHITQCIETDEITFTDKDRALTFLYECTAPITTLSELVGDSEKVFKVTKQKPFKKPIRF